jgi:alkylation response protein AidB-like acyl-CoA dehydrogenase
MSAPPPSDPEALLAGVREFVSGSVLPNVVDWDRDDRVPPLALQTMLDLGLPGALVPTEYGGRGFSVLDMVPVWRTLSQGWISLTGAINPSALATTLLVRNGTEAQRQRWLPRLASSEITTAFSITEQQAGSDLKRIETGASPSAGGGFVLNGSKRWVAGGESAAVIFMLVQADGAERPSCLVLPADGRGSPAWEVESLEKIGYRGVESAAFQFRGLEAGAAQILGGADGLGRGAAQMLDALEVGRINVACRALGILDRVLAVAAGEALGREVGDGVLADHTHAQLRIGEIHVRMLAAESLTRRAAIAVDARAADAHTLATSAKVFASDTAIWALDLAARLAASRSYAADDKLGRLRRDAPQTQIGEGANDALLYALAREVLDQLRPGECAAGVARWVRRGRVLAAGGCARSVPAGEQRPQAHLGVVLGGLPDRPFDLPEGAFRGAGRLGQRLSECRDEKRVGLFVERECRRLAGAAHDTARGRREGAEMIRLPARGARGELRHDAGRE